MHHAAPPVEYLKSILGSMANQSAKKRVEDNKKRIKSLRILIFVANVGSAHFIWSGEKEQYPISGLKMPQETYLIEWGSLMDCLMVMNYLIRMGQQD